jgi:hypothetical protein
VWLHWFGATIGLLPFDFIRKSPADRRRPTSTQKGRRLARKKAERRLSRAWTCSLPYPITWRSGAKRAERSLHLSRLPLSTSVRVEVPLVERQARPSRHLTMPHVARSTVAPHEEVAGSNPASSTIPPVKGGTPGHLSAGAGVSVPACHDASPRFVSQAADNLRRVRCYGLSEALSRLDFRLR